MNLKVVTKELGRTLKRNSPSLLTGIGIAGFASSIVMAVRATPKALEMIDEAKYQEGKFADKLGLEHEFGPKEIAQAAWQCYIPTVGMALLSGTAIIMANRINMRRNVALASLYAIAESGLRDYQDKVVEAVGNKKEELIRGEVAQEQLNRNPIDPNQIVMTNEGKMLCYDTLSGRYFMSDIETLRQIQNDYNERLLSEMTLTLNELYYDMGLGAIDLGDKAGWVVEKGLVEFEFSAKIASNNEPCIVIGHRKIPELLYF